MYKRKRMSKSKIFMGILVKGVLFVFVGIISLGIGKQALRYQQIKEEITTISAEIEKEEKNRIEFNSRKAYYNSDAYIEKIAREQLGMVRSDEIIYINRGG